MPLPKRKESSGETVINRPAEHLTNYNLNPFTIITETASPGPPSPTGLFSHATMPLQKKSKKFKKSVDNYRPREYNIRVLATIAQLAEHLIRNERVVGSNPISGSNKIKASEESEAFFLIFTTLTRTGTQMYNKSEKGSCR